MSTAAPNTDAFVPFPGTSETQAVPEPRTAWERFEWQLVRAGDALNPILVKEARQALKSRQFVITFGLLLLAGWLFSLGWVVKIGPAIYYGAFGPEMFVGYYFILCVAILLVVPFSAYLSLAGERGDGTYELLSITALGARQIISGKLGSAIIQLLIYGSAITPCLAFTYLLRGITLPTILTILTYTFLASVGLSLTGLFLATLNREKAWQPLMSMIFACMLMLVGWGFVYNTAEALFEDAFEFENNYFWLAAGAIFSAYVGYVVIIFLASAAQLHFLADNRSTALRYAMLFHTGVFCAWMTWIYLYEAQGDQAALLITLTFAGFYWFIMGGLMTGEWPELSPRVRRTLPQSFLGRTFLTFLSPGPGTGYVCALASFGAVALACQVTAVVVDGLKPAGWRLNARLTTEIVVWFGLLSWCYLAFYLGIGRALIALARKINPLTVQAGLLIQLLMVVSGTAIPMFIQSAMGGFDVRIDFSPVHVTNPLWTLMTLAESGSLPVLNVDVAGLVNVPIAMELMIIGAATVCLICNLPSISAEVSRLRIAAPQRVAEDDAEQAALRSPPKPTRSSPWDEDAAPEAQTPAIDAKPAS